MHTIALCVDMGDPSGMACPTDRPRPIQPFALGSTAQPSLRKSLPKTAGREGDDRPRRTAIRPTGRSILNNGRSAEPGVTTSTSGCTPSSVPTEDELIASPQREERSMSVVITNPWHDDNPMIYVTEEFEMQTGYSPEEALGRNCRFLEGPSTDPKAVEAIRAALAARTTFTIDLLNYRKSG